MRSVRSIAIETASKAARAHVDMCREIRKRGVANNYVSDDEIKKWAHQEGGADHADKVELVAKRAQEKMGKMKATTPTP